MPRIAKSSATAAVTGVVAAIIAIGTLADSVDDSATTSSMMNSMKVPVPSSTPTGWIRMNIQAMPEEQVEHDEAHPPGAAVHRVRAARPGTAGTW